MNGVRRRPTWSEVSRRVSVRNGDKVGRETDDDDDDDEGGGRGSGEGIEAGGVWAYGRDSTRADVHAWGRLSCAHCHPTRSGGQALPPLSPWPRTCFVLASAT